MEEIFSLNRKKDTDNTCYSIIGLKDNKLYKLENQRNYKLETSNESCTVSVNETPFKAFVSKDKEFSRSYLNAEEKYKFTKLNIIPGNYFPRIYRPFISYLSRFDMRRIQKFRKYSISFSNFQINELYDRSLIISGLNQLAFLKDMLTDVFQTVYPSQVNLITYGNDIKNLLVLSCIEVEAQLKGIYKANKQSNENNNYTTMKEYVQLNDCMQLHNYSIKFPLYPEFHEFTPFADWDAHNGETTSLKWYQNYNAVKHNSETELDKADLESSIQALCAVVVLLRAQYGPNIPLWNEILGNFFNISDKTKWDFNDKLLPPFKDEKWKEKKYYE